MEKQHLSFLVWTFQYVLADEKNICRNVKIQQLVYNEYNYGHLLRIIAL